MPDSTFEEAKRHTVCGDPGEEVNTIRPEEAVRGTIVHVFECKNKRCSAHTDRWMVQTNPDGSIPKPGKRGPKAFALPKSSTNVAQQARDYVKMLSVWDLHPDWSEQQVIQFLNRR